LDRGFYLSASANITRPAKAKLREVFRRCPPERLLVETDAPDMPPWPRKSERHYPWELPVTLGALAETLGLSLEETDRLTTQNAMGLFLR